MRWRVGCLPLECRRLPGIRAGLFAEEIAPDEIEQEEHLYDRDDQRGDSDADVHVGDRVHHEFGVAVGKVAAGHAKEAQVVHRQVDRIRAEERQPEVQATHRVVQHPAGYLRIPVIDRRHDDQHRRYAHHHVEMPDDEVGVGQWQVDRDVAEE